MIPRCIGRITRSLYLSRACLLHLQTAFAGRTITYNFGLTEGITILPLLMPPVNPSWTPFGESSAQSSEAAEPNFAPMNSSHGGYQRISLTVVKRVKRVTGHVTCKHVRPVTPDWSACMAWSIAMSTRGEVLSKLNLQPRLKLLMVRPRKASGLDGLDHRKQEARLVSRYGSC